MTNASTPSHHSLICIGDPAQLHEYIVNFLQIKLCAYRAVHPDNPCRCTTCSGIANQQSPAVTWIQPTGEYVLETLDPLFNTIQYLLEPGAAHIFILDDAHLLSTVCANKLLKVVEEPPTGYSFIFLTADYQALLPTIQSRSIILYQAPGTHSSEHALLEFFIDPEKQNDAASFDTFLRNEPLTLYHARTVVQQLAVSDYFDTEPRAHLLYEILDAAQRSLPQPGGVVHYLRWLFMSLHYARNKPE
jgi:hypothetical protein